MTARRDHCGERYGRWLVLRYAGRSADGGCRSLYECRCDCGAVGVVLWQSLGSGASKSCGCLHRESMSVRARTLARTHGLSKSRTYGAWRGMLRRCLNQREPSYPRYGGRGIAVCDRWLKFENFLADMGQSEGELELDRIDNDKGYSPENCRWATITEQANNKRNNRFVSVNGARMRLLDAVRATGRKYATVYYHAVRSGELR